MPLLHIVIALVIVAVWGTNFVVIKAGLRDFPPFLFATLRFLLSALPWILFIRRPDVAWRWLVMFGMFIGAGQFGLLFLAMRADISPGLASLIAQMQVFFTIGLSVFLFNERVRSVTLIGIFIATLGLIVIALHVDTTVTPLGIFLVLFAAFFWACANITVKKAAAHRPVKIDMLGFMVWSSLFAVPPLFLLTFLFDGLQVDVQVIQGAHAGAWFALSWQVIGNTLFGYAMWNWLLTKHAAAIVTPYALIIPVFGMGASTLVLGEALPPWKIGAALLVMTGLVVITLLPRWLSRRRWKSE